MAAATPISPSVVSSAPSLSNRSHNSKRVSIQEEVSAAKETHHDPSTHHGPVKGILKRRDTVPADNNHVKTSQSHPININWIVPPEYLLPLTTHDLPPTTDLYHTIISPNVPNYLVGQYPTDHIMGNVALSSCPGKKVRLDGPVRGRASVNRDLEHDMRRIQNFGVQCLVCCLHDNELELLGSPWPQYREMGLRLGLEMIRIPMVEGSTPDSLQQTDWVLQRMDSWIDSGKSVLVHCRGGVGRAGVVACCWLLRRRYVHTAERAIHFVRLRRSRKAVETPEQAQFVVAYDAYLRGPYGRLPTLDPFCGLPDLITQGHRQLQELGLARPISIRAMAELDPLINKWFYGGHPFVRSWRHSGGNLVASSPGVQGVQQPTIVVVSPSPSAVSSTSSAIPSVGLSGVSSASKVPSATLSVPLAVQPSVVQPSAVIQPALLPTRNAQSAPPEVVRPAFTAGELPRDVPADEPRDVPPPPPPKDVPVDGPTKSKVESSRTVITTPGGGVRMPGSLDHLTAPVVDEETFAEEEGLRPAAIHEDSSSEEDQDN